jgi:hypothetical protein
MSNYVQLGDVHTYYEEDGEGEALVLLHPGLADSRAFEEYVPEFARHFHVFRPDRRGHGRTPDVEGQITYEQMARDTIAFLERVVGGPATYSATATGRSSRCWLPLSVPTSCASWSLAVGCSTMMVGPRERSSWTRRRLRSSSTTGVPSLPTGKSTSGL